MTDKYAVIGNPIAHSKSPQIHKMFAEQTGQDISYEAILAPLDGFAATVERLRKEGYKGCNVTVPFKFEAFKIAHGFSREVMDAIDSDNKADAVNTLDFSHNHIVGYNTDGTGLVRDITQNLNCKIVGKRVLLMGAGGAAYGVLHPLLNEKPLDLVIVNRTFEKAQKIENKIRETKQSFVTSVSSSSYPGLSVEPSYEHHSHNTQTRSNYLNVSKKQFDLIINATSSSLSNEMPPLPPDIFAPGCLAYDMMYGRETPFMKFAREHGAAIVSDGLGMLVEQAAESFFIWRGVRPKTALVIAALCAQQ
jgi:shikimate dehydrogenase